MKTYPVRCARCGDVLYGSLDSFDGDLCDACEFELEEERQYEKSNLSQWELDL